MRAWYVAYLPLNKQPESDEWYTRELSRWARVIEARLDRNRKQFDTKYLCPICKDARWIDEHGDSQPARIVVQYVIDEEGRTSGEQRCANAAGSRGRTLRR